MRLQDGAQQQVAGPGEADESSVRKYTTVQLLPLLEAQENRTHTFLPQTVPGYAAVCPTPNVMRLRFYSSGITASGVSARTGESRNPLDTWLAAASGSPRCALS
jgi:hypothetical protein